MSKPAYTEEQRQSAVRAILRRREHNRQYMPKYKQEHKAETAEYDRRHYLNHRAEVAEHHTQYHQEHREAENERMRQYYLGHRSERTRHMRQYYQEHREETLEHVRQYSQGHPEVRLAARHKRRALLADSNGNFTAEEFRLLCETYGNRCLYCQEELPLTPDHMVPISRGGSNSIENIVPSCRSCNQRKHTMTYDEFVERLEEEELSESNET